MPKNVKGGPLRFFNNHCCKISKKIEGEPIGIFENLRNQNKKIGIFNSLIVPKNLKEGTFWDFSTFVLL